MFSRESAKYQSRRRCAGRLFAALYSAATIWSVLRNQHPHLQRRADRHSFSESSGVETQLRWTMPDAVGNIFVPLYPVGNLQINLTANGQGVPIAAHALLPAANGPIFPGLPAIGFAATNYINANVTPGVLSNYSAAYPHRSHASCTNFTTPQSACQ